jgi:hypothetical protein
MAKHIWVLVVSLALAAPVARAQGDAGTDVGTDIENETETEADGGWALEAGADRASIYLFRGVDLLADESVVAPRAKLTWRDLTVTYNGYFGDLRGPGRYGEGDLAVDHKFHLGKKATLALGALTYQFNGDAERELEFFDTYEVYGIFSLDLPLAPTLTYNQDIDQVDGGYLSFALSHEIPLGQRAGLILLASAGFDFHYNNKAVARGTFNDVLLSADLPVQLGDHLSVHVAVQRSLAQKALDELVAADPSLETGYGDQTVVTAGATVVF